MSINMSHRVGNPTICIGEKKDADQLRSNFEADQRLCFRYTDSTIPLLSKSQISSLSPSSVTVQPSFCRTWSEPKLLFFSRTGSYIFQSGWNLYASLSGVSTNVAMASTCTSETIVNMKQHPQVSVTAIPDVTSLDFNQSNECDSSSPC